MVMDAIIDDVKGVDDAIRLAVLATSLMKDKADGVGGPTRVLSYKLGDETWTHHDDADIESIERTLPLEVIYGGISEMWRTLPAEFERGGAYSEKD